MEEVLHFAAVEQAEALHLGVAEALHFDVAEAPHFGAAEAPASQVAVQTVAPGCGLDHDRTVQEVRHAAVHIRVDVHNQALGHSLEAHQWAVVHEEGNHGLEADNHDYRRQTTSPEVHGCCGVLEVADSLDISAASSSNQVCEVEH